MTNEERIYKIFSIFYYNVSDEEQIKNLEKSIKRNKILNSYSYIAMKNGKTANGMTCLIEENRKKYANLMYYYNNILKNMTILSKELNLESSLELCIMFSYLLWNGYLSKNREYRFNSKDINRIPGFLFTDIIEGKGVCLNNTEMLKDFLNQNEYVSAMLESHYNIFSKINYKMNLSRKSDDKENAISTIIKEVIKRKKANHVSNLIEENNKIYIFDPTNLIIQSVINKEEIETINGTGIHRTFLYQSYMLCATPSERKLLDRLVTSTQYECPYDKNDFVTTSKINLEILKSSTCLIEDFYYAIKPYIDNISTEINKTKIRKK